MIELYTSPGSAECAAAKFMLEQRGIRYTEYKLGEDYSMEHLRSKFLNPKTFPVVVIEGFYIGGSVALRKYITEESQTTQKLLNEENN